MNVPDQIKVVEREIALRRRAYPKWVQAGTMKQEDADREIAGMMAVLDTLKGCQYYEQIRPGAIRIEIRGRTKDDKKHAVVKLEPDVNNDTLLITMARGAAQDFWKVFSKP